MERGRLLAIVTAIYLRRAAQFLGIGDDAQIVWSVIVTPMNTTGTPPARKMMAGSPFAWDCSIESGTGK
ncbi:MAG TPA: hypothetical protein VID72_08320 [Ktedonobacterales bacterium]|jgi:hypothetical protein